MMYLILTYMVRNINQVYGQQQSKAWNDININTHIDPITKTSIATTLASSTLSPDDNIIPIIKNATEGLSSSYFNYLSKRVLPACKDNVLTICDYISSLRSEINPSYSYRRDIITLLCSLSMFFKNTKPFKEITRQDLISFLDSYRNAEDVDPLHKWIGTYNLYRLHLMCYFKWLYYPDRTKRETKTICYRKHSSTEVKRKINLQTNRFMDCRRRFVVFEILSQSRR